MAPEQPEKSPNTTPSAVGERRVAVQEHRDGTTSISVHNGGPIVISGIVRGTDHKLRIPLENKQAADQYDITEGVGG